MVFTKEDESFMAVALELAEEALRAGEFPVGCVLVRDGRIIAGGRRMNSAAASANELDHAEMVALRRAVDANPGLTFHDVTVYSTMEPCLMCYSTLLLNGVRTMVWAYEDVMGGGTSLDLGELAPLYREMEVTLVPGVMRLESLRLFHDFFTNPVNAYWQGSPLAQYTLATAGKELSAK